MRRAVSSKSQPHERKPHKRGAHPASADAPAARPPRVTAANSRPRVSTQPVKTNGANPARQAKAPGKAAPARSARRGGSVRKAPAPAPVTVRRPATGRKPVAPHQPVAARKPVGAPAAARKPAVARKPAARPVQSPRRKPRAGQSHPKRHLTLPRPIAAANAAVNGYLPLAATYLAMALVFVALVSYVRANPPAYDITLNGAEQRVFHGATIQSLLDDGLVSPTPGNLLAVDGSVIKQGGGDPFSATVDGKQTTDATTHLGVDAQVQLGDGADVTEDYDETNAEIPFDTSNQQATRDSYFLGAFHIYSKGANGVQTTRVGKVSGISVTLTTKNPISAGYGVYDADVADEKVIALTFDDGPWETTPELLDLLKENGAHATFFTVGRMVANYPDTVKREYDEGHQVCTHTWDHAAGSGQGVNLTYMTAEEQVEEVEKGFEAVDSAVGTEVTRIFRAPGGNYYGSAVSNLDGTVVAEVGWDVDTEDWRKPGADQIAKAIENAKPGQVILMHDGGGDRTQTIEALRKALPELRKQGYRFVTIDELMQTGNGLRSISG